MKRSLGLLLLCLSATGCGKIREIKACRALSQAINPALDAIAAQSKLPGTDSERRVARGYAQLVKQLKPQATGTSRIADAVREYSTVIEAAASAVRAHAEALDAGQTSKANEARRELDRLTKRERAVMARLDAECQG
jgi:hypothetical protein